MIFPGFRHFVAEPAKTRVYAFLSSYLVGGLEGHLYPNLYSPEGIDVDATVRAADANRDLVRGIKGHAEIGGFARWGIKVLQLSAEIGRKTSLPVYVHFGQLWGLPKSGANGEDANTILERVIPELQPGDILAHPFTRHPGGFVNREGKVHEVIRAALDRGLKVDVAAAATSPIGLRARRSTPASSPIRWAPTCTVTIPTFRRLPARRLSTPMTRRIRSRARRNSA
jgi:dihydroorotase